MSSPEQMTITWETDAQIAPAEPLPAKRPRKPRAEKPAVAAVEVPVEEQPYPLPENWRWVRLGGIAKWGSGGTPSRQNSEYYGGTIPWIKTGELNHDFIFETEEYLSELGLKNSSAKIFPKGAIALAMYGATIGKTSILGIDAASNQACAVAVPFQDLILRDYLFQFLRSQKQKFIEKGKGGAQPNISQEIIKAHLTPLPPHPEQARIVARLESLLGKIREARELVVDSRNTFHSRSQLLLSSFTKGFDKKSEEKSAKKQLISEICSLHSGQHIQSEDYNSDSVGLPYLTGPADFGDKYPFISKWTEKPKTLAQINDILITVKGAGVGKVNILNENNVCISRQLMALRTDEKKIASSFLFYVLKSEFNYFQKIASGSTVPGIDRTKILNMEIDLPPLEEQKEIVRILDHLLGLEDQALEQIENMEAELDTLEKAILSRAFRGELGTHDPSDAPVDLAALRV